MSYTSAARDVDVPRRQREEMSPMSDDTAVSLPVTQQQQQQGQQYYLTDDIAGEEASDTSPSPAPRRRGNCLQRSVGHVERVVHHIIPHGGILSSAFSMASSSIGAGILGLPSATDATGLVLSMALLAIITYYTIFSMYLLALTAQKTRIKSFEGMARWLLPQYNYAFGTWIAIVRFFHGFSSCVAYVISAANCFEPIFVSAAHRQPDNRAMQYLGSQSGTRLLTSLIWLVVMLPLVIPKHVNSLRVASLFAVLFMVFFSIVIIVHSIRHGFLVNRNKIAFDDRNKATDDPTTVYLFRTGNGVITKLGTFIYAYICHVNALELFWEMKPKLRNPTKYTAATSLGMLICWALYVLVSVFGYFDFGSVALAGKSVLLVYDPIAEPLVLVAFIFVIVKVCVAYALLMNTSRNGLYYLIGWQLKYRNPTKKRRSSASSSDSSRSSSVVAAGAGGNECANDNAGSPTRAARTRSGSASRYVEMDDAAVVKKPRPAAAAATAGNAPDVCVVEPARNASELLLEADDEALDSSTDDTTFVDNIPFYKHLIVVVVLAAASLVCGLFIPKIDIVFGFAGSISGGFISLVCPALYFMYSGGFTVHQVGWFVFLCTYSLLLIGVVGIVWGTCGTIYSVVVG